MKKFLSVILISLLMLSIVPFAYAQETTYNVGDIIQFGSYPQSEVKDEALIAKLNSLAPEWKDWTSYEYYFYNEETESLEKGDYMRYVDIEVAGKKYRGVRFTEGRGPAKGGEYKPNTTYWFKFETLEWIVLDPEEGFVLCKDIIDSQPFDDLGTTNNYEESPIRKWLNYNFYNTSFNDIEKELITLSSINNDISDSYYAEDVIVRNTIEDKVFLLSMAELPIVQEIEFATQYTPYSDCQGLGYEVNPVWHLRTASDNLNSEGDPYTWTVLSGNYGLGATDVMYMIDETEIGVRPAIKISDLSAIPQVEDELPEEPTTPENPDTPEEPDTPSVPENPTDDCSCICHKSGIWIILWKIARFFEKLLGVNRQCACGVAHY